MFGAAAAQVQPKFTADEREPRVSYVVLELVMVML